MSTPEQITANQANAQHSTGPRTEQGKAISSRNALATGLTGRTVLLPSDDLDEYALNLARHCAEFGPINSAETELVQAIANCEWRLSRVLVIEEGLFAQGACDFGDAYAHESRAIRSALIQTQTYLKYERQLKNLSISENRLLRQKAKFIAAFEALKNTRPKPQPNAAITNATADDAIPHPTDSPTAQPKNGFESSTPAELTATPGVTVSAPGQENLTASSDRINCP